MEFEEIDLRPPIIQSKFEELRILRDFAMKVKEQADNRMDDMIEQIIDPDEMEQLQRKILRLQIGYYDQQRRIERLASDAARLGYRLIISDKDETVKRPDGPSLVRHAQVPSPRGAPRIVDELTFFLRNGARGVAAIH